MRSDGNLDRQLKELQIVKLKWEMGMVEEDMDSVKGTIVG